MHRLVLGFFVCSVGCGFAKEGLGTGLEFGADATSLDSAAPLDAVPDAVVANDTELQPDTAVLDDGLDVADAIDSAEVDVADAEIDAAPGGFIEVSGTRLGSAPFKVNLTSEGTVAWAHWGVTTASAMVQKAGTTAIGPLTAIGAPLTRYADYSLFFSWTDGLPIVTSATDTATDVYVSSKGDGFQFDVASDVELVRSLKVFVSSHDDATLTATFTDGSVTPLVRPIPVGGADPVANVASAYLVRFRTASPSAKLRIVIRKNGNILSTSLHAVTLQ